MSNFITVELEEWHGSPVVRDVAHKKYERQPKKDYKYKEAKSTDRQLLFYRNLDQLAEAFGSKRIPVDFHIRGRGHVYLDRGCIKMAEHAQIIKPIENSENGVVDYIELIR